jgi:membrane protein implicated in regulation of membrane protease activity
MQYWLWLLLGLSLAILELLTPSGFFLIILGGAAILVGLLVAAGIFASWNAQAIIFCLIALVIWFTLGKRLRETITTKDSRHGDLVGSLITVKTETAPGEDGSGELWGTSWRLKNIDNAILYPEERALVISCEGITLMVKRVS